MPKCTFLNIRKLIIKLHDEGKVSREISTILAIRKSTVNNIIIKFKTTGTLEAKRNPGRPRKTTNRVDRVIKRKAISDVKKNAAINARELREENLADISQSTVSRRLTEVGLFRRVFVKIPLISKKNKKDRLEFAKRHQHWTIEDWKKVLFLDETKINVFGNDGRRYVRRPKGTRYDSRHQIHTVKHGKSSIILWGPFSWKGVSPIFKIEDTMDSIKYRDIILDVILPYACQNVPRG
ncbi:PREDICTED: transposable element Tc1 transposase [Polistes dominula]|uniref:Transposable element Tc1 transposase n=1 Tax=Polistes dominula TaxID=743375 RepID=A0ABM1IBD1_POLDO|nr:PREDICTED: transposable element Tc1 transposase [Polistes dominula]